MLDIPLMKNNILPEDVNCLIDFLKKTDRFTQGPMVRRFEEEWSKWLGVKHSLFVNSGASANIITMAVLKELYGEGEVLVPTITWSSDITAVLLAGFKPVLIDISLHNLAMQEQEILNHITEKTKAVFLSHILGHNGLTPHLVSELQRRNIILIEDVCESHGATYVDQDGNIKKCGTVGLVSNFSFYYAHHMSTIEGGMICTNDDRFYQYARMFRSHGMLRECDDLNFKSNKEKEYCDLYPEFLFMVPGFNMRSTELNAVIGLNQLTRLDANIEQRRNNYELFLSLLDKDKYYTDFSQEGNSNYAFVILLAEPNEKKYQQLISILKEENVEFRRGTAGGGNQARQPFVRRALPELQPAQFRNAELIHKFGIYTGNYPALEHEKIELLCRKLNHAI